MDKLAKKKDMQMMISMDNGRVADGLYKSAYALDYISSKQMRRFYQDIYDRYPTVKAMLSNIYRSQ